MDDALDDYDGYYDFVRETWSEATMSPAPLTAHEEFSPLSVAFLGTPPMSSAPPSPETPPHVPCPPLEICEDFPPVPTTLPGPTSPLLWKGPRIVPSLFPTWALTGRPSTLGMKTARELLAGERDELAKHEIDNTSIYGYIWV